MKILIEFHFLANPGHVKHLKSGKIQKFHCRWKFGSNFTLLPPKLGKIQKMHSRWKFGSNFAFLHLPELLILEIRQNPEIPLMMKIWFKFHIFAPKIGQNLENALAMKIRLHFQILAPSFLCKHLKSGKIQKFHCRWKFSSNFTFLPPKLGKIQKLLSRWKFGYIFTFLHLADLQTLEIRQNPEIPLPMKIRLQFHIFAIKIGQNPENALAMKIRLEFRILAPPGAVNTWNSAKSRN